jgi:hypothetical protein
MSAFADLSELVNRATGGNSGTPEAIIGWKDNRVGAAAAQAPVAGRLTSLWQYNGSPAHGVAPGAVSVPTNATDGALKQTNPGGGRQKWLTGGWATANAAGTLILYDRLLHIGGLSGTTTTAQTVGGSLTRYTSTASVGNQIFVEIYTAIGGTATTVTASYTDQGGTSGVTSQAVAIGGTGLNEAQRIIPLTLAAGDTGVQAVASVTVLATTGTAGNFGVSIVRPLYAIPISVLGVGGILQLARSGGFSEVLTNACLAFAWLANTTTVPQIMYGLNMSER